MYSRDIVAIGEVDHISHVYTSYFSPIVPLTDVHTMVSSLDTFEDIQCGYLNIGILSFIEVLPRHVLVFHLLHPILILMMLMFP